MSALEFSTKGKKLLKMYEVMARDGYQFSDGTTIEEAFSNFELRTYREGLRQVLSDFPVATILDYGCGGADWGKPDFDDSGQSAIEYFALENAYRYEPARDLDQRQRVDCVVSFDVLEHIFISDIPSVIRDMFSYAKTLLVLNIACYPANALLPNGENAHVTVRNPDWWKGMIDGIAVEFPDVSIYLICSTQWRKSSAVHIWKANSWQESDSYVI